MRNTEIPVPKYRIGDVVFYASFTAKHVDGTCPDCHDKKVWHVTTPAGLAFDVPCQRCSGTIGAGKAATVYEPDVKEVTIHRYEVGPRHNGGYSVRYTDRQHSSCDEDQLYATREEAHAAAVIIAAKKEAERPDKEQNERARQIWKHDVRRALAGTLEDDAIRHKKHYENAIFKIGHLPEEAWQFSKFNEGDLRKVAGFLLEELNEPCPWEDD